MTYTVIGRKFLLTNRKTYLVRLVNRENFIHIALGLQKDYPLSSPEDLLLSLTEVYIIKEINLFMKTSHSYSSRVLGILFNSTPLGVNQNNCNSLGFLMPKFVLSGLHRR